MFAAGIKRIFALPNVTDMKLFDLYKQLRCGLFHNGMIGDKIVLKYLINDAIVFSYNGTIDINPKKFLAAVIQDFNQYINDLKNVNNIELRNNFDRMFFVV
jgi:hypothetical protein